MRWRGDRPDLDTSRYSTAVGHWLDLAMERAASEHHHSVTEGVLLATLIAPRWDSPEFGPLEPPEREQFRQASALLSSHLAPGVVPADALAAFEVVTETGAEEIDPFQRGAWRSPLDSVVDDLPDDADMAELLAALFSAAADLPDGDLLTSLFSAESLLAAIAASAAEHSAFTPEGAVDDLVFLPRARYLLDRALANAAKAGQARCDAIDLLIALVAGRDTYTQLILRRAGVATNSAAVKSYLATAIGAPVNPNAAALPAVRDSLSDTLIALLDQALSRALATGGQAVGERELLAGLFALDDPRVRHLADDILGVPLDVMNNLLHDVHEPTVIELYLPADVCPVRNATVEAASPVLRDDLTTQVVKVFFRKKNRTVLLHGERGTGHSTMPDLIAATLRSGRFPALRHTQVIAFDLSGLDGTDYTSAAERVLAFMDSEPERIYAVDGFGGYFVEHFAQCARRFAHTGYRLLLTVSPSEFTALQSGTQALTDFLDPIELPEPSPAQTQAIVAQAASRIGKEYGVSLAERGVQAAVRMAADYIMSARFPAKAVDLLERATADLVAEAEMTGSPVRELDRAAVAKRVATLTGLPVETIMGTGQDKDYVDLLSTSLVGQEAAVAKVAGRLDLIQKSMVDRSAPAAVFLFCGLSGTGKTELAKQIAQIYSASHAMVTFAMGDFGEPHTVSGLIGSPPSYVGYEEGGKLINALNRDPYAVVLLDEVEKAHPAIWDPFLNLFDEGVITDTRGVTASGSRAFFVLTSNIGQYEIADMLSSGADQEEIDETVTKLLPSHKHFRAGIPCFRPEFVGRIMRRGGVVAFNALSHEALLGIARHGFSKIAKNFAEVQQIPFICDDAVLDMIAQSVFQENAAVIRERRPGYLGARRIQTLLDQHVNNKLAARLRQLSGAALVRVVLEGTTTEIVPVFSETDADALLTQRRVALVDRVERRFNQIVAAPDDVFAALPEDRLLRLDRLLSEVGAIL